MKGDRHLARARYWNSNGKAVCVVASITEGIDWTTYIGADDGQREEDCIQWTASNGSKLLEEDARYFFPEGLYPFTTFLPYRD